MRRKTEQEQFKNNLSKRLAARYQSNSEWLLTSSDDENDDIMNDESNQIFYTSSSNDANDDVNDIDDIESEDYAVGFCSHNEDNEFLIELHNDLTKRDFIVTLLHELVHVSQDLCGLTDTEERESAAEQQEVILFRQFQNTY